MASSDDMLGDLDRIEAALQRLKQPSVGRLQPPLPASGSGAALTSVGPAITGEMERLYAWRNGMRSATGDLLTDLWFFPGFWFPPLEEAVRNFSALLGAELHRLFEHRFEGSTARCGPCA
jgi:hypothetical protein